MQGMRPIVSLALLLCSAWHANDFLVFIIEREVGAYPDSSTSPVVSSGAFKCGIVSWYLSAFCIMPLLLLAMMHALAFVSNPQRLSVSMCYRNIRRTLLTLLLSLMPASIAFSVFTLAAVGYRACMHDQRVREQVVIDFTLLATTIVVVLIIIICNYIQSNVVAAPCCRVPSPSSSSSSRLLYHFRLDAYRIRKYFRLVLFVVAVSMLLIEHFSQSHLYRSLFHALHWSFSDRPSVPGGGSCQLSCFTDRYRSARRQAVCLDGNLIRVPVEVCMEQLPVNTRQPMTHVMFKPCPILTCCKWRIRECSTCSFGHCSKEHVECVFFYAVMLIIFLVLCAVLVCGYFSSLSQRRGFSLLLGAEGGAHRGCESQHRSYFGAKGTMPTTGTTSARCTISGASRAVRWWRSGRASMIASTCGWRTAGAPTGSIPPSY